MLGGLLVAAGAALSIFAFPRFGPGWLILPGIALFLAGLRRAAGRAQGARYGALFGLVFFGGLLWWLSELGLVALIPLVVVQAAYFTAYGGWLAGHKHQSAGVWYLLAVGGWALMELIRYLFPVDGFEWGAAGYALSDQAWARALAPLIGTTGITVLVVATTAFLVLAFEGERSRWQFLFLGGLLTLAVAGVAWNTPTLGDALDIRVAIVQGSTPCPFEHCPPDERLHTFEQHLALTGQIAPGSVDLVVWSEGSTGSTNADPVLNPEVGDAIAAEARRIGAWFLVGGDRSVSETHWINANVVFGPDGQLVGEYRKQHPVPFGEYIPWRPIFEWIPALDQVPRDMIPGEGPVLFDLGNGIRLGSVISFEGGFSRYARGHAQVGANLMVVATNEGSYGATPASDQFIGMTRMRAAELGTPVIHAAVTGKSVFIGGGGQLISRKTGLGSMEILTAVLYPQARSIYTHTGDVLMLIAAVAGWIAWWQSRQPLVVSITGTAEEE